MNEELNEREIRTRAVRKLASESDILLVKYRIFLGVPLNAAVRLILPNMSNVSAIKLVRWHTEMEEALKQDDYVLHDVISRSLFPSWAQDDLAQPTLACYIGQFPYGFWEYAE